MKSLGCPVGWHVSTWGKGLGGTLVSGVGQGPDHHSLGAVLSGAAGRGRG